jgi:hypothetical protein
MPEKSQTKIADASERVSKAARMSVVKSAPIERAARELLTERGYFQEILKDGICSLDHSRSRGTAQRGMARFGIFCFRSRLQLRFDKGRSPQETSLAGISTVQERFAPELPATGKQT